MRAGRSRDQESQDTEAGRKQLQVQFRKILLADIEDFSKSLLDTAKKGGYGAAKLLVELSGLKPELTSTPADPVESRMFLLELAESLMRAETDGLTGDSKSPRGISKQRAAKCSGLDQKGY